MSADLPPDFDDNPEWAEEDIASALPADEVLSPNVAALLVRGDQSSLDQQERKHPVSLRLSYRVLAYFRATGPGWQARINDTLERSIKERG